MAGVKGQRTPACVDRFPDGRRDPTEESVRQKICQNTIICQHSAYLRAKEDYLMGINFSRLADIQIWKQHFKLS